MRLSRNLLLSAILACLVFLPFAYTMPDPAPKKKPVPIDPVDEAIGKGIKYLLAKQNKSGSFGSNYPVGVTGLSIMAILHSKEDVDSAVIEKAIDFLVSQPCPQHTYQIGIRLMTLELVSKGTKKPNKPGVKTQTQSVRKFDVDKNKFDKVIAADAKYLIETQFPEGDWTYSRTPKSRTDSQPFDRKNLPTSWSDHSSDNSNTQYAMLGLNSAAALGVPVPREVWERALNFLLRDQSKNGGWTYQNNKMAGSDKTSGMDSMTASGVCGVIMCLGAIYGKKGQDGAAGAPRDKLADEADEAISKGLAWLGDNFKIDQFPKGGWFRYYCLYALERCGIFSEQRYFGKHDWYEEGKHALLKNQESDGSWCTAIDPQKPPLSAQQIEQQKDDHKSYETPFAILFLQKASQDHKPIGPIRVVTPSKKDSGDEKEKPDSPSGN
ncbi:MAG: prenyltransferase/squalene oxidase repeat-containing protein [Planctomycetota bacterium]